MQERQAISRPCIYRQHEFRSSLPALWTQNVYTKEFGVRNVAKQEGKKNRPHTKRPNLRYFFLEDELHKKLSINLGKDTISAWNYPRGQRYVYNYSTVLRRHEPAFTTKQVCEFVNRTQRTIDQCIRDGMIRMPQYTYGLDENRKKYKYMWREKDIMELHAYLASLHIGRPRKDGEITNNSLPTPRELRALINDEAILYVKQGDTFVPSWKAKEIK